MIISDIPVLQLIPKSHISGRIDHIKYDEQIQADLERVDQFKQRLGKYITVASK